MATIRPISWMAPRLRRLDTEELRTYRPSTKLQAAPRISDVTRNHIVAILAEFVGTFMFLFFAFTGAQIANSKSITTILSVSPPLTVDQLLYISLGFGISLAANVAIWFRVSGGAFNPAVTLGLCLSGAVPITRGVLVIPAQLVGGIASAFVVGVLFPGEITFDNSLSNGTTIVQGVFIEMFTTAMLILTILMLAVEKQRATFIAPLIIGMSLFLGHFISINFTGAGMNPARSFGPAVVLGKFPTYHWIYWVGPVLAAVIAAGLYRLLKALRYESANPGQDDDGLALYQVVQTRGSFGGRRGSTGMTAGDEKAYGGYDERRVGPGQSKEVLVKEVHARPGSMASDGTGHSCIWCEEGFKFVKG